MLKDITATANIQTFESPKKPNSSHLLLEYLNSLSPSLKAALSPKNPAPQSNFGIQRPLCYPQQNVWDLFSKERDPSHKGLAQFFSDYLDHFPQEHLVETLRRYYKYLNRPHVSSSTSSAALGLSSANHERGKTYGFFDPSMHSNVTSSLYLSWVRAINTYFLENIMDATNWTLNIVYQPLSARYTATVPPEYKTGVEIKTYYETYRVQIEPVKKALEDLAKADRIQLVANQEQCQTTDSLAMIKAYLELLKNYNIVHLCFVLELYFGLPSHTLFKPHENDLFTVSFQTVEEFFMEHVFCNVCISSHIETPHASNGCQALVSFLLIVNFLDRLKQDHVIPKPDLLFAVNSPIKSSQEILMRYGRECMFAEGDLLMRLNLLGYTVSHTQNVLSEYTLLISEDELPLKDLEITTDRACLPLNPSDPLLNLAFMDNFRLAKLLDILAQVEHILNSNATAPSTEKMTSSTLLSSSSTPQQQHQQQLCAQFKAPLLYSRNHSFNQQLVYKFLSKAFQLQLPMFEYLFKPLPPAASAPMTGPSMHRRTTNHASMPVSEILFNSMCLFSEMAAPVLKYPLDFKRMRSQLASEFMCRGEFIDELKTEIDLISAWTRFLSEKFGLLFRNWSQCMQSPQFLGFLIHHYHPGFLNADTIVKLKTQSEITAAASSSYKAYIMAKLSEMLHLKFWAVDAINKTESSLFFFAKYIANHLLLFGDQAKAAFQIQAAWRAYFLKRNLKLSRYVRKKLAVQVISNAYCAYKFRHQIHVRIATKKRALCTTTTTTTPQYLPSPLLMQTFHLNDTLSSLDRSRAPFLFKPLDMDLLDADADKENLVLNRGSYSKKEHAAAVSLPLDHMDINDFSFMESPSPPLSHTLHAPTTKHLFGMISSKHKLDFSHYPVDLFDDVEEDYTKKTMDMCSPKDKAFHYKEPNSGLDSKGVNSPLLYAAAAPPTQKLKFSDPHSARKTASLPHPAPSRQAIIDHDLFAERKTLFMEKTGFELAQPPPELGHSLQSIAHYTTLVDFFCGYIKAKKVQMLFKKQVQAAKRIQFWWLRACLRKTQHQQHRGHHQNNDIKIISPVPILAAPAWNIHDLVLLSQAATKIQSVVRMFLCRKAYTHNMLAAKMRAIAVASRPAAVTYSAKKPLLEKGSKSLKATKSPSLPDSEVIVRIKRVQGMVRGLIARRSFLRTIKTVRPEKLDLVERIHCLRTSHLRAASLKDHTSINHSITSLLKTLHGKHVSLTSLVKLEMYIIELPYYVLSILLIEQDAVSMLLNAAKSLGRSRSSYEVLEKILAILLFIARYKKLNKYVLTRVQFFRDLTTLMQTFRDITPVCVIMVDILQLIVQHPSQLRRLIRAKDEVDQLKNIYNLILQQLKIQREANPAAAGLIQKPVFMDSLKAVIKALEHEKKVYRERKVAQQQ